MLLLHLTQLQLKRQLHDPLFFLLPLVLEELLHGPPFACCSTNARCTLCTTHLRVCERWLIWNEGAPFDILDILLFSKGRYLFLLFILEFLRSLLEILLVETLLPI
jgi:hypothetical protein